MGGASSSHDCHVIALVHAQWQVQLSVYSEEDSRSNGLNRDDSLLTSKIPVHAFGQYVEELHAHADEGFREQFYVRW